MMALGMRPRQIAAVVLLEGTLLGVLGAVAGLIGGLLLSYPLVEYGLDYSSYLGRRDLRERRHRDQQPDEGAYDPDRMAIYVIGAVVFTTLSAIYPAVHVARLQPVEAMHHV